MSTNIIDFNQYHHVHLSLDKTKDPSMPASDLLQLHKQLHDSWRWYGIKPELRRLYELWDEIEAEDKANKAKTNLPRRICR